MSINLGPVATRDGVVREELRHRLENVAAYYRRCGETGEAPDPDFIDKELHAGTRDVLAAVARTEQQGQPLRAAA